MELFNTWYKLSNLGISWLLATLEILSTNNATCLIEAALPWSSFCGMGRGCLSTRQRQQQHESFCLLCSGLQRQLVCRFAARSLFVPHRIVRLSPPPSFHHHHKRNGKHLSHRIGNFKENTQVLPTVDNAETFLPVSQHFFFFVQNKQCYLFSLQTTERNHSSSLNEQEMLERKEYCVNRASNSSRVCNEGKRHQLETCLPQKTRRETQSMAQTKTSKTDLQLTFLPRNTN